MFDEKTKLSNPSPLKLITFKNGMQFVNFYFMNH